ncbi:MAG: prepilin-type N-terminal cleavage/methylation domain-containing protein [Phycisphaerae bacterium]
MKCWHFERSGRKCGAFTLVEILIVVVIIGILAAIAVPKLSNASQVARESSLKEDLRFLRTQINVYRANHQEVFPGYPGGDTGQTPTQQAFNDQLTQYTNLFGNTSPTQTGPYTLGPYLPQVPANPVNSLTTIKMLGPTDAFTADGATGWLYQPSTGLIKPNLVGQDSEGHPFDNY